jgi:anthraniloyl-CoA monooxygenase
MRVLVVGAGPAGLSFAILMAEAGRCREITVIERNAASENPGWGVTLESDALPLLGFGDALSNEKLEGRAFWYRGERILDLPNPPGVPLVTVSRAELLRLLRQRCTKAGVQLMFDTDAAELTEADLERADLIVAADGANSSVRQRYVHAFAPAVARGRNCYAWLATPKAFHKLTILVRNEKLPLLAWGYKYSDRMSTLIVECTEQTFKRPTISQTSAEMCCAAIAETFARELDGHPVLSGTALRWQRFRAASCRRLFHRNVVLIGDAAHTTHFSNGFGTMCALDDALALHIALGDTTNITCALEAYEASQQPKIERFQATSMASMQWAEAMIDAAEDQHDGKVRELIAARWSAH